MELRKAAAVWKGVKFMLEATHIWVSPDLFDDILIEVARVT